MIRTTHAGSLPRPAELNHLWAEHSRHRTVDPDRLAALVESATEDVLARQEAAGLASASNGEQGRASFFGHVRERFSGFAGEGDDRPFQDIRAFPEYFADRRRVLAAADSVSLARLPAATSEVTYLGTAAIEAEIEQLTRLAEPYGFAELFVTVPSPGIVASAMTNRYYPSLEDYVDAVADGLAHEYKAVLDAGLVLQIDAPDLALERHVTFADRPLSDFTRFCRHVIAAIDRALGSSPRDRVRLHVCWGNYDGPHCYDVPLADMIDTYASAPAATFVLSQANPRHAHEYRLLDRLPPGANVVLGCIDTTSNYVEHPQVVADRLVRAAGILGDPARLVAGTDCGFGTSAGARDVASDVAWKKLASLTEGTSLANEALGLA